MFSYIPYSDSPQYAYSPHVRGYAPAAYPYAHARALAENRAARPTAARRAAAEQQSRARFVGYPKDEDEDECGSYGYNVGYTPRQRAYLEAQRKQQAAERERARLISNERDRREVENRMRRAQAARESLEQFYRSPGLQTPNGKPESAEAKHNVSERTSRTPSPARPVPSKKHTASSSPIPSSTLHATEANTTETFSQPTSPSLLAQEQTNAATKIQSFYRSRKALSIISQLEAKFEDLKRSFTLPKAIDYISADGEVITLKMDSASLPAHSDIATSSAKLAFTHTNVFIRAYDEDLNRILAKLDAVESWGEKKVRERRRDVVRKVELEAARVETVWAEVWKRFIEKAEEEEVNAASVDEPEVPSSPVDGESAEMTVDIPPIPLASVEHSSSSAVEPVTSTSSDGSAEDTFALISPTSSSPAEQMSTIPFPFESAPVEESISAQLPDAIEDTRSESGATELSSMESDIESSDSGYESFDSISVSSEQLDEKDDSDIELGHEEEADFVML